jgi:hypothetical protein
MDLHPKGSFRKINILYGSIIISSLQKQRRTLYIPRRVIRHFIEIFHIFKGVNHQTVITFFSNERLEAFPILEDIILYCDFGDQLKRDNLSN